MSDWAIRFIEQAGYFGVLCLMAVEGVVTLIPSELIMAAGGMAVARGTMHFWPLMLAGAAGSTLGTYAWFLLGYRLGYDRLRPLVRRWGRWLTLDWRHIERGSAFFRRHGQWVVFAMRFSPVGRSLISLPAGLARMNQLKFLAFTFAGAMVWNTLLIKGGHWLAAYSKQIVHWVAPVVIGFIVIGVALYLWRVATWKPYDDDQARG